MKHTSPTGELLRRLKGLVQDLWTVFWGGGSHLGPRWLYISAPGPDGFRCLFMHWLYLPASGD